MRPLLAIALVALIAGPAAAQHGKVPPPAPPTAPTTPPHGWKPPVINMPGMGLDGTSRGAQLLYFLERADQELARASLERRSFIPELVRSVDEEAL